MEVSLRRKGGLCTHRPTSAARPFLPNPEIYASTLDHLALGSWLLALQLPRTLSLKCELRVLPLPRNPTSDTTMADLLNAQDIKAWLKKLPQWDHDKKHIERVFEFDDFDQAIEFVNGVAEIAGEDDHHPEIDIRYSKVTLRLSTHSEGGLTDMDFEVAEKIDTLVDE